MTYKLFYSNFSPSSVSFLGDLSVSIFILLLTVSEVMTIIKRKHPPLGSQRQTAPLSPVFCMKNNLFPSQRHSAERCDRRSIHHTLFQLEILYRQRFLDREFSKENQETQIQTGQ
jgi:hypothetical protein